jgi:hypothetical protein
MRRYYDWRDGRAAAELARRRDEIEAKLAEVKILLGVVRGGRHVSQSVPVIDRVAALLGEVDAPLKARHIMEAICATEHSVRKALHRLKLEGRVVRTKRGYRHGPTHWEDVDLPA